MPTRTQIEARALEAYDLVSSGARREDSGVELKADWPTPDKAARRIAGHANAARGEGILWIVGLDEAQGVCPFAPEELANWWSQVRAVFDSPPPSLVDVVVQTEDGPVQALYFDVSLSPFVVKNPIYGSSEGGAVSREVPWREGTATRSATREDLIRMLVPMQHLPDVEVLHARVTRAEDWGSAQARSKGEGELPPQIFNWSLYMELYVTPPQGELVVLPVHRTRLDFGLLDGALYEGLDAHYSTPSVGFMRDSRIDSASVETTQSEAVVHLPGRVHVTAYLSDANEVPDSGAELTIRWAVRPVHTEHVLDLTVALPAVVSEHGELRWEMRAQTGP